MNLKRLIASGLLAGLVLNIAEAVLHGVLLAEPTATAMDALGKSAASGPMGLTLLVLVTFVQGLAGMWLYAAGRFHAQRFGAGAIGVVLWLLSVVYAAIYLYAGFPGVFPDGVVWWPAAYGLVEYPLAMIVGASVYREKKA
jgi:hypothetical protein